MSKKQNYLRQGWTHPPPDNLAVKVQNSSVLKFGVIPD